MNLYGILASEISRVTAIRASYESLRGIGNVNVEPAIFLMQTALDRAVKAANDGDALEMIDVVKQLEGFKE